MLVPLMAVLLLLRCLLYLCMCVYVCEYMGTHRYIFLTPVTLFDGGIAAPKLFVVSLYVCMYIYAYV